MKQIQFSIHEEPNVPRRQYEQPRIEVVELDKQSPLLSSSPGSLGSPNAGDVDEEDW
jgi:hypothetical protein